MYYFTLSEGWWILLAVVLPCALIGLGIRVALHFDIVGNKPIYFENAAARERWRNRRRNFRRTGFGIVLIPLITVMFLFYSVHPNLEEELLLIEDGRIVDRTSDIVILPFFAETPPFCHVKKYWTHAEANRWFYLSTSNQIIYLSVWAKIKLTDDELRSEFPYGCTANHEPYRYAVRQGEEMLDRFLTEEADFIRQNCIYEWCEEDLTLHLKELLTKQHLAKGQDLTDDPYGDFSNPIIRRYKLNAPS